MPSSRVSGRIRRLVVERARGCCEYCLSQAAYSNDPFSVEHIVPISSGGSSQQDNLALSCQGCNGSKYTATESVDVVTGVVVPLYNPRRDSWSSHFGWNFDFTLIVGLSPTGRATIAKLQLNRQGVVNIRRLLRHIGEHPPELSRILSQGFSPNIQS